MFQRESCRHEKLDACVEAFQLQDSQSKALGFPSLQRVFVPHPIQDRTDDEMSALADSAYDSIVAAITKN